MNNTFVKFGLGETCIELNYPSLLMTSANKKTKNKQKKINCIIHILSLLWHKAGLSLVSLLVCSCS